jgi:hypothetical protein
LSTFYLKFILPSSESSLTRLPALIQANVFKALQQGMMLAEQTSQTKYLTGPRPDRLAVVTGLLRSSVKSGAYLGGDPGVFATGTLTAGMAGDSIKYAAIHEHGGITPPHLIEARNVPYLKFFWKKKGVWFRGRSVNHPGSRIPARPYLRPALVDSLPVIEDLIKAAIDRAYKDS